MDRPGCREELLLKAYCLHRPANPVPLIGFGGTHYAVRETEIALTSRGAFGHIAHTREVARLDEEMVRAMIVKSGAVAAYIDRKALDREELKNLAALLKRIPFSGFRKVR